MAELSPVKYSGAIQYKNLTITNVKGITVNIFPIVSNINIYEDLFANTLSATINLYDSNGFTSMFPIIGQETVTIELEMVGADPKTLKMVVYKITREQESQLADNVTLHLVSIETYINSTTSISKSFKGTTSDIVKSVFNNYIGTTRPINIESSKNNTVVICPKWNPIYFINWLAARSIPVKGNQPSYFFYENINGFNFESLESKFSNEPKYTWIKQPPNAAKENKIQYNTATIESYHLLEGFDFLSAQSQGMMSSELYITDLISNSYKRISYNYIDKYNEYKHLNKDPISSKKTSFGYTHEQSGVSRILSTHSKVYTGITDINKYSDWVLQRSSFIQQLNGQRLVIRVAGQGLVTLGDVVYIKIPLSANNETKGVMDDPILSGKYIITAIAHTMSNTIHRMVIEVSKESILEVPIKNG